MKILVTGGTGLVGNAIKKYVIITLNTNLHLYQVKITIWKVFTNPTYVF